MDHRSRWPTTRNLCRPSGLAGGSIPTAGHGPFRGGRRIRTQDDVLQAVSPSSIAWCRRSASCWRNIVRALSRARLVARAVKGRRPLASRAVIVADTAQRTLPSFRPRVRRRQACSVPGQRGTDEPGEHPGADTAYLDLLRSKSLADRPAIQATQRSPNEIRADPRPLWLSFDSPNRKSVRGTELIIAARQDSRGLSRCLGHPRSYPRARPSLCRPGGPCLATRNAQSPGGAGGGLVGPHHPRERAA